MANHSAAPPIAPYRRVAGQTGSVLGKYLEDRGPHLAAMVAYYALLSLFPFLFLVLSTLGLAGQIDQSSALVKELERILPSESVHDLLNLVHSVQANAGTFFVIGFVGIIWSTLGFYSALESMLNIVFRVNNRGFVAGKWISFVLVLGSLAGLFSTLLISTAITGWLHRHESGVLNHSGVPHPFAVGRSRIRYLRCPHVELTRAS